MPDDDLSKLLAVLGLQRSRPPTDDQWGAFLSVVEARLRDAARRRDTASTTGHLRTEAKLLSTAAENRALLEAIPDMMVRIRDDGMLIGANVPPGVDPPLQLESQYGRHVGDVRLFGLGLPPETLEEGLRLMQRALSTGRVQTLDTAFDLGAGRRQYENRIAPLGIDEVIVLVRDVTGRARAERALRRSEAIYANLFQHATDGIVLHDSDGVILDVNHKTAELFACEREDLLGARLSDLCPEDARGEWELATLLAGDDEGAMAFEMRFQRRHGGVFIAEVTAAAFEMSGRRVIQAILRDVTERRRFEESLKLAKEEAERANRAKSQFLSNMSHELRTPLNSILGFGRVLERGAYGPLNSRQRQYLQDIVHSGEHMLELVNNLLDLRRLEARDPLLGVEVIALRNVVEEAVTLVNPLADERGHGLDIELSEELPEVAADSRAVVRVLVNLLSNAVKYTPHGGHITVRAREGPGSVRIEVEDNGIGISPLDQARIFNYFEQVRSPDGQPSAGSGIGLALSRELVERMGGAIGVESEPGRGSCFYFTLPALSSDPSDTDATLLTIADAQRDTREAR